MKYQIETDSERRIRFAPGVLAILVCLTLLAGTVPAQEVTVETLMPARQTTSLVVVGDRIIAGTDLGGVLVMDRNDPTVMEHWASGQRVSGNLVEQLSWTGRNVWVATSDNGLTRIGDLDSEPTFRQYLENVGSRNITCVTGTIVDGAEVVYYGMFEEGIGRITDGVAGYLYNAGQDGLISDSVNDMQFLGTDLYVATDVGISRMRENLFSDQNEGLTTPEALDLCLDGDGNLIAAVISGVFQWDEDTETWGRLGQYVNTVSAVAVRSDGQLFALAKTATQESMVYAFLDGRWEEAGAPSTTCGALFAGDDVWVGGKVQETGMATHTGRALVSRMLPAGGYENWTAAVSLVRNCEGIGFGQDGTAWVGSWLANAISAYRPDGRWEHIYEIASESNGWTGLFDQYSNVLCIAGDQDGSIWAGQFSKGVLRIDPQTLATEHVTSSNSGLDGGQYPLLLNILSHPDGPLLFQHDLDGGMVDVLLDPADWENPASWISLPKTNVGGVGAEGKVWDAVLESRDVIWFTVEGHGLVRWDINGVTNGPEDELTWTDFNDDYWAGPVTAFTDTIGRDVSDARGVFGLAIAPDGTIWAGGNGVVRFGYDLYSETATAYEYWEEKTAPYQTGLINGSVLDVAVDVNGDAWAATVAGLNRIRSRDDEIYIDTFIDVGNYLLYPNYTSLYSYSVVSELPGIAYRRLATDATGERMLVSSDLGAAMLHIEEGYGGDVEISTTGIYCYPNPWNPAVDESALKLGGFAGDANDGPAAVEIYTLEGQLVFQSGAVQPDTGFWTGKNRPGQDVATGLYLVRISRGGRIVTRTLAVVR